MCSEPGERAFSVFFEKNRDFSYFDIFGKKSKNVKSCLLGNGFGNFAMGGQPPYSHETNYKAGTMFGTFHDDLSKRMRDIPRWTHTLMWPSCTRKSPNSGAPKSTFALLTKLERVSLWFFAPFEPRKVLQHVARWSCWCIKKTSLKRAIFSCDLVTLFVSHSLITRVVLLIFGMRVA